MGVRSSRARRRLRAALHAAGGAPRLFRAARGAGAGPLESGWLLVTSAVVLLVVAPRAAGAPGRQNAVRHFVWQALLTARHGEGVARAVADAQEHGSAQPADSATDRHNNAVAQAYGAAHAHELAAGSTAAALRALLRAGLAMWDTGELAGVSAAPAAGHAGRRRRGWRGRATPRTRT
jgi:hypothetical protein